MSNLTSSIPYTHFIVCVPRFSIPCMHTRILYTVLILLIVCILEFSIMNFPLKINFHIEDAASHKQQKKLQQQTEEKWNYETNTHTLNPSKGLKIEIHKQTKKMQNRKFVYINELRNSKHVINVQWPGKLIRVLYDSYTCYMYMWVETRWKWTKTKILHIATKMNECVCVLCHRLCKPL